MTPLTKTVRRVTLEIYGYGRNGRKLVVAFERGDIISIRELGCRTKDTARIYDPLWCIKRSKADKARMEKLRARKAAKAAKAAKLAARRRRAVLPRSRYASENKLSLLTVMEKKQKKIAALMQGHTFPFKALFAIRTWDKSKEGLIAKTTVIKNAINGMNSAQYAESTLPSTSKKLFFQTWPGWTWSKYNARKLYGENRYIADMLPIASTFTGHLETAEAIYEGPNQNLVGLKTFSGSGGNASPQHAVLLGMSGAGKSVTICDLLSQTENFFAYTVIIEEGLSYGIYTQTVEPEAKPIVIQPDGDITINYLDTRGLPLSPDHLASATALVARMVGTSQSEDKQMLRQAQIAKYVNLLYEDVFQDWSRKNEGQMMQVARHACALARYRKEKMPPGATMLDSFADFRDQAKLGTNAPEAQAEYLAQFSDDEVLKFLKDPSTVKDVRNLAFAYLKTDEYPQSISDASGIVPPHAEAPAYFAVTGTPNGGRNDISIKNDFYIILDAHTVTPMKDPALMPQAAMTNSVNSTEAKKTRR